MKQYLTNLWNALLGRRVYQLPPGVYRVERTLVVQGGGGPGEPDQ